MSTDPTTIVLDLGQLNLLISGLNMASSVCDGASFETRELIGHPKEYSELGDQIVAQIPGEDPAALTARARLAVREGRATPIRRRTPAGLRRT